MQETLPGYSWFLIMCRWEPDANGDAIQKFDEVYQYLNLLTDDKKLEKFEAENPDDPLFELDSDSLKALNLIGRRKFVIIGQAKSNKLLQKLALMVGLDTHIKVEVFPATLVHDLFTNMIMQSKMRTT